MGAKPEHLKESTFKRSVGWFRNARALIKLPKDSELFERKEQGQEKMFRDGKMAQVEKQVRNHSMRTAIGLPYINLKLRMRTKTRMRQRSGFGLSATSLLNSGEMQKILLQAKHGSVIFLLRKVYHCYIVPAAIMGQEVHNSS